MLNNLGKYRIEDLLGEGSFARVYRATDTDLDRAVALKVLKPAWLSDAQALNRFKQEAKTMARLHHPHIATIFEVGQVEGQVYLAQFLVEGESLAARLARAGALPWPQMLAILQPVASALDYAHGQGLVHRDIKPSNILLDKADRPYLSDFGLVRAAAGSTALSSSSGGMIGTPGYMAPEQWRGQPVTSATDVYALSCVTVEMLTGQILFSGSSAPEVMTKHVLDEPNFPTQWPPGVPGEVNPALWRGLAKDPTQRHQHAGELAAALAGLSVAEPKPEPPPVSVPEPAPPPEPEAKPEPTPLVVVQPPPTPRPPVKKPPLTLTWRLSRRNAIRLGVVLLVAALAVAAFWLTPGPTPLLPLHTSDSGLWAVVMSNKSDLGQQVWRSSPEFPTDFIDTNWNKGANITSVAYGNDLWTVVMSNKSDLGQQVWRTSAEFPADFVTTNWKNGANITSVAYGNGLWAVVMSSKSNLGQQVWRTSAEFPADFVTTNWKNGANITSVAYGNGLWAVVMSSKSNLGQQVWRTSAEFPADFVTTNWKNGANITSVAYGNGLWAVVMSSKSNLGQQVWRTSAEFPADFVTTNWKNGANITSVAYGNGLWAVVMSSKSNLGQQVWRTSAEFPADFVSANWDKGANITSVAR